MDATAWVHITWVQQAQHGCNSMGAHHMGATAWVHITWMQQHGCTAWAQQAHCATGTAWLRLTLQPCIHSTGASPGMFPDTQMALDTWTDSGHVDGFRTHGQIPDTWIDSRHMDRFQTHEWIPDT